MLVYDGLVNLIEEISRRFSNDPKIAALALFGSRALGSARGDSDLDVAVLPASTDSEERRYLQADLAAALCDLVPSGRVDVVLLDEASDVLRQRVFEHGRVLVLRDPGAWRALRVRTMREYGDREPYREILRQGLRRRLLSQETEDGRPGSAVRSLERLGRLSRQAD